MNKIRIIDLLNKIANGEIKLGAKFNWHYKLYDIELIFTKRQGALGLYFQEGDRLIGLFERFNYQILTDEIEVLEEEKKIPEKICTNRIINTKDILEFEMIQNKINVEYTYAINEIIDYLKSKGE